MAYIHLDKVSVDFPIYDMDSRSLKKHFIHLTTGGLIRNEKKHCLVRGLDDITLCIEHGDRIGLLGHNGAGKSSLLRLLAGIYTPTYGSIKREGQVSTLFNIALGFDEDATGYENIIMRGILMGMPKALIKNEIPDIEKFTELGSYLNMPLRTYSSGMRLRLAFGVATCIHPEILLIDETVSAGDANFMLKAQQRLNKIIDKSSIVVLAVHNQDMLRKTCNKIALMGAGKIIFFGAVEAALDFYADYVAKNQ